MTVTWLLRLVRRNLLVVAGAVVAVSWALRLGLPALQPVTSLGPVVLQTAAPEPQAVSADQALAVPTPASLSAAHAALRRGAAAEGPIVETLGHADLWLMNQSWALLRLAVSQAEDWFRQTYLPSLRSEAQP
jgi:hypothetical protein